MKEEMPSSHVRLAVTLSAISLLAMEGSAAAEEGAEPVRLSYTAGAGCPSESAFMTGVRARTSRVRWVSEGERARVFVVTLSQTDKESSGHLVVRLPNESESERDVTGDTCEEVASALALMAALSVDPDAAS